MQLDLVEQVIEMEPVIVKFLAKRAMHDKLCRLKAVRMIMVTSTLLTWWKEHPRTAR